MVQNQERLLRFDERYLRLRDIYIPPYNSKYFDLEMFDQLEQDIIDFSSTGSIILMGDLIRVQESTPTLSYRRGTT